ncbi:uncharacterized protein LOC122738984 [Dromiciops gliroides]|uniref:uncharacterized protein LOC122738984 n=1 Tax=Dromiciops gliroides TaxID=33562 RepID=UPI001CC70B0A|nr:uncharacterized protein LOC122738984 [Dromiciops gliroides]
MSGGSSGHRRCPVRIPTPASAPRHPPQPLGQPRYQPSLTPSSAPGCPSLTPNSLIGPQPMGKVTQGHFFNLPLYGHSPDQTELGLRSGRGRSLARPGGVSVVRRPSPGAMSRSLEYPAGTGTGIWAGAGSGATASAGGWGGGSSVGAWTWRRPLCESGGRRSGRLGAGRLGSATSPLRSQDRCEESTKPYSNDLKMSSWVKVNRGHTQRCAADKSINPYKPHLIISPGDGHIKESEDTKSNFEELLGKEYDYSKGSEDNYERYQYSHKDDDHSKDHRKEKLYQQFYQQIQNEYDKERPSDCTIVSINKDQRDYAVSIGHRLQDHGLVVEMIYLTSEASLTCALQEVKNDGSPFCILVEQSNVALSSCTVISLHKSITIHRHMPLEDALALVAKEFGTILAEREQQEGAGISQKAADLVDDYLERDLCESYSVPLGIKHLLFLLSEGKHLYQEELNTISDYLKTRKEELEGFVETPDTSTAVVNALIEANLMPRSHTMGKPPPLLPTPSRNSFQGQPLLPPVKPPLLGDRPGGLLPTPGHSGPKGKPPPLLAVPSKRPGLLGYAPHQPVKRPMMWEKPALLPTPVAVQTVQPQRAAKPKPF